jgi:hypothetical protein
MLQALKARRQLCVGKREKYAGCLLLPQAEVTGCHALVTMVCVCIAKV